MGITAAITNTEKISQWGDREVYDCTVTFSSVTGNQLNTGGAFKNALNAVVGRSSHYHIRQVWATTIAWGGDTDIDAPISFVWDEANQQGQIWLSDFAVAAPALYNGSGHSLDGITLYLRVESGGAGR